MENRCEWCLKNDQYIHYHDNEWGVPLHDDLKLFEFLILEGVQAGLSWLTVLKKRNAYLQLFDGFDPQKIAIYDQKKIDALMLEPSIIRNKLKIQGSVTNAKAFLKVQQKFGSFDHYIWRFIDGKPIQNSFQFLKEIPAQTILSELISKDLKSYGFTFVGPTIVYAHMQATGMVNDHLLSCFRYEEIKSLKGK